MRNPTRSLVLPLALAALAAPLSAQQRDASQDSARVLDRLEMDDADETLVTRRGDVALLIAGSDLVVQFTDAGLEELEAEEPEDDDESDSLAYRLMKSMLRAGMRELFDNALAVPIADIGRAEVVDSRLVLENHDGEPVFDLEVNDRDVMDDFEPEAAREFAREIRARM